MVNIPWEPVIEDVVLKNPVIDDNRPAPKTVMSPTIRIVENDDPVKDDIVIDMGISPDDEGPVYTIPAPANLDDEKSIPDDIPFIVVEKMPEFPGGMKALQEFLAKNTGYPQAAAETGIQGTVYLSFVVEKDGSVSNIKTLRGIGGGCTEEAERVIKLMPKWKPGNQFGKPVRVLYNVPVIFRLN